MIFERLMKSKAVKFIFTCLVLSTFLYYFLSNREDVYLFREQYAVITLVILIPVQAILAVSPFPSEAIAFSSSLFFGFYLGVIVNWVAWVLGSIIEYHLVSFTAKDLNIKLSKEKLPKWARKFSPHNPYFLILGLWMPFGSHIVSASSALYKVNRKRFLICMIIGYLPLSVFVSGVANGIFN